jgi:hypothetical protein
MSTGDVSICECGHPLYQHEDSDSWGGSGEMDEVWTNDACLECGRDQFGHFLCMHFSERKEIK